MKDLEKTVTFDAAARTKQGVTIAIDADTDAPPDRPITATGRKLVSCDGAIAIAVKLPKR